MTRGPAERSRWRTGALVAASIAIGFLQTAPAQVPLQGQQPAGSALRPAVMGPSEGVSTGHLLTTAAAFGVLLKGGNAFDAGVASLLAGGVLEQDLYSLGGEALGAIKAKATVMAGETDFYFTPADIEADAGSIPGARFQVIPSLWDHIAGAGLNSTDSQFIEAQMRALLAI